MGSGHSRPSSAEPAAVVLPLLNPLEVDGRPPMAGPNLGGSSGSGVSFFVHAELLGGGGGGGISPVPWWRGSMCHFSLLFRNFSDTRSFI